MNKKQQRNYLILGAVAIILIVALVLVFNNGGSSSSSQNNVIRVGALLPLSGPASYFGVELKNGLELCDKENLIIYEDSQSSPVSGVSGFNKLIDVDNINVGIVAVSSIANAIAPIAIERKVPLIMTLVSASNVAKKGGKYVFRYFTSGEQEAPIMSKFAVDRLGLKKASIIYINNEYGLSYKNSFETSFRKDGGQIAETEAFSGADSDFKSQLLKIKESNSDSIYVIGYNTHIINIIRQIKELGMNITILSNWILASPDVQNANKELLNGVYFTSPKFYYSNDNTIINFKKNYKTKYGKEPSAYAAFGCDVASMLDENKYLSKEDLMVKLRHIENRRGVMGTLNSDTNGEITVNLIPVEFNNNKMILMD